eukprot:3378590-Prorocentrum_lima.AAC.1
MTSSLVGSEMCIRDRAKKEWFTQEVWEECKNTRQLLNQLKHNIKQDNTCLLYTSDAADDM